MAAQLSGEDLKIFIEDSGWKKTTLSFNRQFVKVELVVISVDGVSILHDASSKPPQVDTHTIQAGIKVTAQVRYNRQSFEEIETGRAIRSFLWQ